MGHVDKKLDQMTHMLQQVMEMQKFQLQQQQPPPSLKKHQDPQIAHDNNEENNEALDDQIQS